MRLIDEQAVHTQLLECYHIVLAALGLQFLQTGFKGLLKKIVMFIVIAVAYSIQKLLNDAIALREIVIMFYICNEALSLLENAAMFIPIPDKLKDVLLQLRDKEVEDDGK